MQWKALAKYKMAANRQPAGNAIIFAIVKG
jgi:hypothetical protein